MSVQSVRGAVGLLFVATSLAGSFGVSACGAACGAGTRLEGGVCVVDVGGGDAGSGARDGAASDAGPFGGAPLEEGDELLFDRQYNRVELVPGLVRCLSPALRRRDGRVEPLAPAGLALRVAAGSEGVVAASEPGDCTEQRLGLVALREGNAQATLELRAGARTVAVTVPIGVLAGSVRVTLSGLPAVLAVGSVERWSVEGAHAQAVAATPPLGCDCALVRRWVSLEATPASVLEARPEPGGVALHARAEGRAALTAVYSVPGAAPLRGEPHALRVVRAGTLVAGSPVNARTGAPPLEGLATGACVALELVGTFATSFEGEPLRYHAVLREGVRWRAGSAASQVRDEPAGASLCAQGFGDLWAEGCAGSACDATEPVLARGEGVASLRASAVAEPLRVRSDPRDGLVLCVPTRVEALDEAGAARDVTLLGALRWTFRHQTEWQAIVNVTAALDEQNEAPRDASGARCFRAQPPAGGFPAAWPLRATAALAGRSTYVDFVALPPE